MRVKTLQVVWHEREPVCSLDFSKSGVLATGGADKSIKVVLTRFSREIHLNHNTARFQPLDTTSSFGFI